MRINKLLVINKTRKNIMNIKKIGILVNSKVAVIAGDQQGSIGAIPKFMQD
jgi:hypothetical protein